jgi:archaellum component FlaC
MKKKIINGILMAAMLFAGTTSFVSCKDNVDDEVTEIYKNMGELGSQIDAVKNQITALESSVMKNSQEIEALKTQLKTLQGLYDELNGKVNKNAEDIKDLQARVKKLENAVLELQNLIKKAITGVEVQETWDPVIGTINLDMFQANYLCAYVGENLTDNKHFPVAYDQDEGYGVDPTQNQLLPHEIGTDPETGEKWDVWNSGKNSYLIQTGGNAGALYFTVNPIDVDPSQLNFKLVNSLGGESPVILENVRKSDHLITYSLGKHGNGIETFSRDGSDKYYLLEAEATIKPEDVEKIHLDYTKYGYSMGNFWDAQEMYDDINLLMANLKATWDKDSEGEVDCISSAFKILYKFYEGIYNQRKEMGKQALEVSWNGGEKPIVSKYNIATISVNPLAFNDEKNGVKLGGYKAMYYLGQVKWSVDFGITPSIAEHAETATYGSIRVTGDELVANAKAVMKKLYNKALKASNGNIPWALVQPILLTQTNQGIIGLEDAVYLQERFGQDANARVKISCPDSKMVFLMTSLTEEYIVPAYMKYIAVLGSDGKPYMSRLQRGSEKVAELDIPMGDCEIVYQVMDYYGGIVTKRYPITRVK